MAAQESSRATHININYIKSPDFREIACDGALGGPTPRGHLWVAFYTERFPLPRIVRHTLQPSGDEEGAFVLDQKVSAEVLESRDGLVRNVEFGVYLTAEAAQNLYEWLGKRLSEMKGQ